MGELVLGWKMLAAVAGVMACVVGIVSALFFWSVKWLLDRYHERLNQRFAAFEQSEKELEQRLEALQGDLPKLRAGLPEKYVQRSDWIRFSSTIDAKLDAVRDVVEWLKARVKVNHGTA